MIENVDFGSPNNQLPNRIKIAKTKLPSDVNVHFGLLGSVTLRKADVMTHAKKGTGKKKVGERLVSPDGDLVFQKPEDTFLTITDEMRTILNNENIVYIQTGKSSRATFNNPEKGNDTDKRLCVVKDEKGKFVFKDLSGVVNDLKEKAYATRPNLFYR